MRIKHVEIGNFLKLQAARIDFADATTIFVGANNSGKTSAMVALRRFLIERATFAINDFTLSHWITLDALGRTWEGDSADAAPTFDWNQVLPFLDIWLDVPMDQIHYVQPLLPTLDWDGSTIGVRLRYEPKDLERLKYDYLSARKTVDTVMSSRTPPTAEVTSEGHPAAEATQEFSLWPRSLVEFLTRELNRFFEVRAYLLDPARLQPPFGGLAKPQALPTESEPVDGDPFKGLIRIDETLPLGRQPNAAGTSAGCTGAGHARHSCAKRSSSGRANVPRSFWARPSTRAAVLAACGIRPLSALSPSSGFVSCTAAGLTALPTTSRAT